MMAFSEGQAASLLIGGLIGLAQQPPFPAQQFVQTRGGQIGDTGENVGEPGLGIDVVDATGVVPAPEHVIHRLQNLGRAREGFALAEQPGVYVVEKWLALSPGARHAGRRRDGH